MLLATGGVQSAFLLWFFVLISVYSCLLDSTSACLFLVGVPLSYLVSMSISAVSPPTFIVLSRVFVLVIVGGMIRLFRVSLEHYVAGTEHAERTLRQNERYFRSVTEHALDVITIVNGDGCIRYISPSVERTLGYDPARLVDHHLSTFIHPDDWSAAVRYIEDQSSVGNVPTIELRVRHLDGTWRFLEVVGRYLVDDPDVAGIALTSRDVSERKQLEQQLLQSKKMEAVGQLTAGIAHDFNNSLTVIGGFAELMQDEIPKDDDRHAHLAEILHASKSSANLIRQLLTFSRKQIVEPVILSINDTVKSMEVILTRTLGEGIALELDLAPHLLPVKIDPAQVELTLLNLAVNARDVMLEGGLLCIATRNVSSNHGGTELPPEVARGDYVLLTVQDTGAGMSEDVKERVFEPFFSTKERGKGTGLGLATVYGVVKQNGGHIAVESELGSGTAFEIYLPGSEEEVTEVLDARGTLIRSPGSETILIVEDDPGVRELVRNVLEPQGYCLLEAENGEEALRRAADSGVDVDLLLTDVVMPGMRGDELAKSIAEAGGELSILYISGYTETRILQHPVERTRTSFLQKPFSPADLVRKVRWLLDRSVRGCGTPSDLLSVGQGDTGGCFSGSAEESDAARDAAPAVGESGPELSGSHS